MTRHPIIFSGPMVRAIRDLRKSMTRRVVKDINPTLLAANPTAEHLANAMTCPYGGVGHQLWVKETYWTYPGIITDKLVREGADTWPRWKDGGLHYDADGDTDVYRDLGWKRKPSIFMPRHFSRLTLESTSLRIERLQEITEANAIAEGFTGVAAFRAYWNEINGTIHPWSANDWVWAITFERVKETEA